MTHKELEDYIYSLPNTKLDYPFGKDVAVYKVLIADKPPPAHVDAMHGDDKQTSEPYISTVNEAVQSGDKAARDKTRAGGGSADTKSESMRDEWKMFALIPENKDPLQISLKCDPQLAKLLREKYETVLEGYHLNKKHWNTILLTGQLSDDEITGLILHSYNLVTANGGETPEFS